jgi:hypothetical protein
VTFPEEVCGVPDAETTEALWDELFKHNRRQQERFQRALEERRSRGESDDSAFENALDDLGLEAPGEESEPADEPWHQEEELFADEAVAGEAEFGEDDPLRFAEERHPLLKAASDLLKRLHLAFHGTDRRFASSLHTLFQGAGDMVGGLAQALSGRADEDDFDDYGLRVTQLKRALRGAAFARGAIFSLRPAVTAEPVDDLRRALEQLEQDIFRELGRLRPEYQGGEP